MSMFVPFHELFVGHILHLELCCQVGDIGSALFYSSFALNVVVRTANNNLKSLWIKNNKKRLLFYILPFYY